MGIWGFLQHPFFFSRQLVVLIAFVCEQYCRENMIVFFGANPDESAIQEFLRDKSCLYILLKFSMMMCSCGLFFTSGVKSGLRCESWPIYVVRQFSTFPFILQLG